MRTGMRRIAPTSSFLIASSVTSSVPPRFAGA
jgi:hypothetical protein